MTVARYGRRAVLRSSAVALSAGALAAGCSPRRVDFSPQVSALPPLRPDLGRVVVMRLDAGPISFQYDPVVVVDDRKSAPLPNAQLVFFDVPPGPYRIALDRTFWLLGVTLNQVQVTAVAGRTEHVQLYFAVGNVSSTYVPASGRSAGMTVTSVERRFVLALLDRPAHRKDAP